MDGRRRGRVRPPWCAPAPDEGSGTEVAPLLELRIHGVNNTAPHQLLDRDATAVERVAGDDLGGFWRPVDRGAGLAAGHPGRVPAGVEREAYSWGGLARTTPTAGTGVVGVVVHAAGRLGWALLAPFGLVNVASWSRRLEPGDAAGGWQAGRQAAGVRVFGLLLTLLLVGSVSVVSLDLVGTQCFADGRRRCGRLPGQLDVLTAWDHGQRLAATSLVPLVVLGLLVALAAVSRTRYEQLAALPVRSRGGADAGPALATPGFWANASHTASLGRLHVAGALFFMVLATAWHQVFGTGPACASPRSVLGPGGARCWDQVVPLPPTGVPFAVTLLLAVGGLVDVLGLALSARWGRAGAPGSTGATALRRRVTRSLTLAAVLLVAHLVLLAATDHVTDVTVPLLGLVATPVLLITALLAIALAALGWRRGRGRTTGLEAWSGRAPGVFLLLALGLAVSLSTLVVVGTGDWLNGARSAGELLRPPGEAPAPGGARGPDLMIPPLYVWFGAATLLAVVPLLGAVLAAVRRTAPDLPGCASDAPAPVGGPARAASAGSSAGGPTPTEEVMQRVGVPAVVRRARRQAAIAHRAEPFVGLLAGLTAACASLALLTTVLLAWWPALAPEQRGGAVGGPLGEAYAGLVDAAAWASGGAAVAVVAGLVGGAVTGRTRPLGLLWDLMCFLPRTAHPFGPPCYAERVVPELVRRYHDWLAGGPERRVLVSAYSLGAVLAVSSLFALRAEEGTDRRPPASDRVALLTYGTQLRPYFGRMFPELLGPAVLGTRGVLGASLLTPDPWQRAIARDLGSPPAGEAPAGSLRALLTGPGGVRWLSLWRRTDYLGFPVDRYGGGTLDRCAEEIDTSGYLPQVATHSGYARAPAYDVAVRDLGTRSGFRSG